MARLHLAILWHQHQPCYGACTHAGPGGCFPVPWVRLHALRDYYSMAAMVAAHPNLHLTINLTPVLLRQIEDHTERGWTDMALELSRTPTARLKADQREEIARTFFDADWHNEVYPHPRYKELFDRRGRGEGLGDRDMTDLRMFHRQPQEPLSFEHSQIIASPIIPQRAWVKIKGVEQYEEYYGRCVDCDLVDQEIEAGERIVAQNASFIAFAPYASRRPFETWIVPLNREAHFAGIASEQMRDLAAILKETLLRLDVCLGDPPYNYLLLSTDSTARFHWHIEIIPRLSIAAGFELGSGMFINTVAPERAAAYLRGAKLP